MSHGVRLVELYAIFVRVSVRLDDAVRELKSQRQCVAESDVDALTLDLAVKLPDTERVLVEFGRLFSHFPGIAVALSECVRLADSVCDRKGVNSDPLCVVDGRRDEHVELVAVSVGLDERIRLRDGRVLDLAVTVALRAHNAECVRVAQPAELGNFVSVAEIVRQREPLCVVKRERAAVGVSDRVAVIECERAAVGVRDRVTYRDGAILAERVHVSVVCCHTLHDGLDIGLRVVPCERLHLGHTLIFDEQVDCRDAQRLTERTRDGLTVVVALRQRLSFDERLVERFALRWQRDGCRERVPVGDGGRVAIGKCQRNDARVALNDCVAQRVAVAVDNVGNHVVAVSVARGLC